MATTVTAIRTALATVVTGLTPVAPHHDRSSYSVASEFKTWDERGDADIDREFSLGAIPVGRAVEFGIAAEVTYSTTLDVTIGHAQTGDKHAGEARRDDDVQQISQALCSKANYPSGVRLIVPTGSRSTATRNGKFWLTTLSLRVVYTRAT